MSGDTLFVLIVSGVALGLFVTEFYSADIVALMVMISLGLGGILDLPTLFSGFGSPVILTIIGTFMLTSALEHTGVMAYLGQVLVRLTENAGDRLVVGILSSTAALMSFMMNPVASVALVAPIGRYVAKRRESSPSLLLMPIAFGGILGSLTTLLANRSLLISGMLTERGLPTFGLLDFLPVGGPIAVVGILYLVAFAPSILAKKESTDSSDERSQSGSALTATYRLNQRLFEVEVLPKCLLVGQTLAESSLGSDYGVVVTALVRAGETIAPPVASTILEVDDWLLIEGHPEDVASATIDLNLAISNPDIRQNSVLFANDTELAEVSLAPHTDLIGSTLGQINFREKYGLNVLAIWSHGAPIRSRLGSHILMQGDALLVQGESRRLTILNDEPDFIVLTHLPETPEQSSKAIIAVLILLMFMVVVALKWLPVSLAALIGGIAVVITGCQTLEQARASIQWQTLFLIGGMLPMATALETTGAADLMIATVLTPFVAGGPRLLLFGLFLMTVALAQFTSGTTAILIMGSLSITTALQLGVNPQAFALAVTIGAGTAFISPISHPANLIVMGPGGYRFKDFARLGLPLVLIVALGVLILIPYFYAF